MADYSWIDVIHPKIPNDCMTPLECCLLTRILGSKPDGDGIYFFADESSWNTEIYIDDELTDAVRQTIDSDLRKDVNKQLSGSVVCYIELDELGGYKRILRDICVRHPDRLPYIAVEQSVIYPDEFVGGVTIITPTGVHVVDMHECMERKLIELGLEKEPHKLNVAGANVS